MTWTFRAVLALLRGAVVSWLAFSLFAVAGFSLVLCLGYIDCGPWKLEGGGEVVLGWFLQLFLAGGWRLAFSRFPGSSVLLGFLPLWTHLKAGCWRST